MVGLDLIVTIVAIDLHREAAFDPAFRVRKKRSQVIQSSEPDLTAPAQQETEVLGVGITGVNAGDMIAEATLAIEMGATVTDLMLTIHPHPTLSETIMEAAEVFHGHSPHFFKK